MNNLMKIEQNKLSKRRERHFGDRVIWCFESRQPSVTAGLLRAAAANERQIALVCDELQWTYAELVTEIRRVSVGVSQMGVSRGDRVIMLISNRPEFITVFFAILWLGAVAVPIDVRLKGPEVLHVVKDTGAKFILHDENLLDRVPPQSSIDEALCAYSLPIGGGEIAFAGASINQAVISYEPESEEDVAVILYTSGSTGKPKGAAITYLNITHSVLHHSGNLNLTRDDRIGIAVPLSHVTGLMCGVVAPLVGGSTLLLARRFKAAEFLAMAARYRMTYTVMVPAMYNLCLLDPNFDSYDLSNWRVGHFGGAPMPSSLIAKLVGTLPGLILVNGYGSTETCSAAVMTPLGRGSAKLDSVGKPLSCIEVMVVNPDTCIEVKPGEHGEIWVRSPGVVRGYWNNPQATTDGIVSGFWRSGDIGYIDAEGFVYILDRLKDMINRGGYKIYCAVVEDVLLQVPGILEVALVGRPDPVLGERIHAFVYTNLSTLDEGAIRAFCNDRLADYQVPETFTVTNLPLPRNSAGKVAKLELRAMASQLPPFVKSVSSQIERTH